MTTVHNEELERRVIAFYRDELLQRYAIAKLRDFEQFDGIPDVHLNALRDFFLEDVYPPFGKREELDDAFHHLSTLLRSPRRLRPLLRVTLSSAWHLGNRFPAVIAAGRHTVAAFEKTRGLEDKLIAAAHDLNQKRKLDNTRNDMALVLAQVPEETVLDLVDNVVHLLTSLSDVGTLESMVQIIERCLRVMESKPQVYKEHERRGAALGLSIVRNGLALFERLDPEVFPEVIEGIRRVELDWYRGLVEEAQC